MVRPNWQERPRESGRDNSAATRAPCQSRRVTADSRYAQVGNDHAEPVRRVLILGSWRKIAISLIDLREGLSANARLTLLNKHRPASGLRTCSWTDRREKKRVTSVFRIQAHCCNFASCVDRRWADLGETFSVRNKGR